MLLELFTGKDSFRAQQGSGRRNVSVQLYTRVPDDGEGRQIIPLFQAHQKQIKGYGKQSLIAKIPATAQFAHNDAGQWFRTRYEVAPLTEVLIEYSWRNMGGGFKDNREYMLIKADPNAPLYQVRIDLPIHFLAAVTAAHFEGRFEIITDDEELRPAAIDAWRKYLQVDDEYPLSFYMDSVQPVEDRHFRIITLEQRMQAKAKVTMVEDSTGKSRPVVTRTRRIKVR